MARNPIVDYRVHRSQGAVSVPAGSSQPAAVWYRQRFKDPREARDRETVVLYADAGDGASMSEALAECRDAPARNHPDGRAGGAGGDGGACEDDEDDVDGTSPSARSAAFRARPGSEAVGAPFAGPAMGRLVG